MILRGKKENDRYGFVDMEDNWIIMPEFEAVDVFREGVCWVRRDGRWGLIDSSGTFLIPPRYDGAREFDEGRANIKTGDKWGVTDRNGTILVRPEFDYIDSFKEGVALVKLNGKYGFVFLEDNRVIKPEFDDVRGFSEGLAAVKTASGWGYINTDGNIVIAPSFHEAGKFKNGRAFVTKGALGGYIDSQGHRLDEFEEMDYDYDWSYEMEPWHDRGIRTLHGFIDRKGNYVVRPKFQDASDFESGMAFVRIDRKWGVIDPTGAYLVEPSYKTVNALKEALRNGETCIPASRVRGKESPDEFILEPADDPKEGELMVKHAFGGATDFINGLAKFKVGDKLGLKDVGGRVVIKPFCYQIRLTGGTGDIEGGYIYASMEFNEKGNPVIKWGVFDRSGTPVVPFVFDSVFGTSSEGMTRVMLGEEFGFADCRSGAFIEPFYNYVWDFAEGLAHIRVTEGQIEEGILDEDPYTDSEKRLLDSFKSLYDSL